MPGAEDLGSRGHAPLLFERLSSRHRIRHEIRTGHAYHSAIAHLAVDAIRGLEVLDLRDHLQAPGPYHWRFTMERQLWHSWMLVTRRRYRLDGMLARTSKNIGLRRCSLSCGRRCSRSTSGAGSTTRSIRNPASSSPSNNVAIVR
jgi:hypothetical protein